MWASLFFSSPSLGKPSIRFFYASKHLKKKNNFKNFQQNKCFIIQHWAVAISLPFPSMSFLLRLPSSCQSYGIYFLCLFSLPPFVTNLSFTPSLPCLLHFSLSVSFIASLSLSPLLCITPSSPSLSLLIRNADELKPRSLSWALIFTPF